MLKPILFNAEMVKAILEGRKTETRRLVKPQPPDWCEEFGFTMFTPKRNISGRGNSNDGYGEKFIKTPYQVGDILYVRETWQLDPTGFDEMPPEDWWIYKATDNLPETCLKWRPSIHMPREAARIFLKVTEVRVERVQDISQEDIEKEGLWYYSQKYREEICINRDSVYGIQATRRKYFKELWNSTIKKQDIGKYDWDSNPWVFVIKFERITKEAALSD